MARGLKTLAAIPAEPIPLSVLTGFLGSGKTTFLGRVLASPDLADTAVVISEFGDQPKVINGASDLMVAVFGDAGRHARAAVGCASLPRNVAVEVDAIFEVR